MLPRDWPLVVYEKTQPQFEVVRKILNSPQVARLLCATDAGREGDPIFRYIYAAAACRKPFSPSGFRRSRRTPSARISAN